MAVAMVATCTPERRQTPRLTTTECEWLTVVRLLPGREARVVNLSSTGALVETPARLLPGTGVSLLLGAPDWRQVIDALIVRCAVCALIPEDGARYRAGLLFRCEVAFPRGGCGYQVPDAVEVGPASSGTSYPSSAELPC